MLSIDVKFVLALFGCNSNKANTNKILAIAKIC
jgi:hypothetical protein